MGQVRSGSVQAMMVGSIAGGRFRIRHGYEAFEGQLSATETGSVLVGDITVPLDRLAWMHALPGVFVGACLGATAGAPWAIVGAAVGAVVGAVWGLTSGITWDIFNGPDADANVQQIVEHLQVLAEPERGRKVHEAHLAGDLEWPEGGPSDGTA